MPEVKSSPSANGSGGGLPGPVVPAGISRCVPRRDHRTDGARQHAGRYRHVYAPLQHAEWHGWTITDVVFPSFLWIVGVAMTLSLGKRVAAGVPRRKLFLAGPAPGGDPVCPGAVPLRLPAVRPLARCGFSACCSESRSVT